MLELLQGRRVLVVAPHCDDEVLGCGGLLLSAGPAIAHLGLVHVVAADGIRASEAARVRAALGVHAHATLSGIDGSCAAAHADCVDQLGRQVREQRPDVVLVPHGDEDHPDHKATWNMVREAVRAARYASYAADAAPHRTTMLLAYEIWTPIRYPSYALDISGEFERKLDLMRLYGSQLKEFPYLEYLAALNGWRGLLCQKRGYVEAFEAHAVL